MTKKPRGTWTITNHTRGPQSHCFRSGKTLIGRITHSMSRANVMLAYFDLEDRSIQKATIEEAKEGIEDAFATWLIDTDLA